MSGPIEQRLPDIGDFKDVEVIEILVKVGDQVELETPLVTLETDKATMDVPATVAGRVSEIRVAVGERVSKGALIALVEASGLSAAPAAAAPEVAAVQAAPAAATPAPAAPVPATPRVDAGEPAADVSTQLLVLGAGPGGYTAAFRAADLGLQVTLVERWPQLGGVCLNVGCIPSKALLHAARVIDEAASMAEHGISFGKPTIDLDRLRGWKDRVVGRLTGGLASLARQRKVTVLQGTGKFLSPHRLAVVQADGSTRVVGFEQCIIAAGSEPVRIPGWPVDPRVIDSTGALELEDIPGRLLVIGGGIIGLEMACVYDALGSRVSVVELTPGLMPGCDRDLVRPFEKRIRARYEAVMTGTKVSGVEALEEGIRVTFEGDKAPAPQVYDRVLVAVGRTPNGRLIDAELAGVTVNERGFIATDRQMRSNVPHIFAIGDVVGQPMLAHKATHEGKVAAEVA
ncbi:MAG: dihydrolipoyl dehydrogenase, partial [Gammaproteobacteria bacterium]|nr:dihydrolipoyl dehydrogenase [Gammaproteobacteria bacterium]